MRLMRVLTILTAVGLFCANAWASDVILNEYNAVGGGDFLNGGDSSADESGGRAFDSYFGRVPGNGGDWFELVVITDHLDMRGWQLDIYESGALDETLILTAHPIWSDLRSGTIITVAEDVPGDISYNPAAGDWWINVQANDDADGLHIEASNFPVSSSDWQLRIRDAAGEVVFGPAGEGVSPLEGVGGTDVFRLETDPSAEIAADSDEYDDGSDISTFGAPNHWGSQELTDLRTVAPVPGSITVVDPNGGEAFACGDFVTVRWESEGLAEQVLVEFSIDGGLSWSSVYPPNRGNSGEYRWQVPAVDTDAALVRVASASEPAVYDVSDAPFTIICSELVADLTRDGFVNFFDFAVLAQVWMQ